MKTSFKKYLGSLVILVCGSLVSVLLLTGQNPSISQAQTTTGEIPYGGTRAYTMTCTCSGNALVYIYDYRTKSILALVYQPGGSVLYRNFNVYGATYLLGTYRAGGTCQIYVGEDCVTLNSSGMMGSQPGTGTS